MALIAKKTLRYGHVTIANAGTAVSPESVEEYGWHDDVEDDGQEITNEGNEQESEGKPRRTRRAAKAQTE